MQITVLACKTGIFLSSVNVSWLQKMVSFLKIFFDDHVVVVNIITTAIRYWYMPEVF